jgi:signal transduction histidine kinase
LSLGLRLMLAAAGTTLLALVATALVLNFLFQAYFKERIHQEIESYLVQLTANTTLDAQGELQVRDLADPRFSEPLSGFYWQAQLRDLPPIQSPSFWSMPLDQQTAAQRGTVLFDAVIGPDGARYLTGGWTVTLQDNGADQDVSLIVALDQTQFDQSVAGFSRNVSQSLGVLGLFLLAAAFFQVRIGLSPLERLRSEVKLVKEQPDHRLAGDVPTEVLPLIDEVNDLLDRQQETIEQARGRASNMAHGLKTPLTIMQAISRDLRVLEQPGVAEEIDAQVDNMQHFVERELARTRDQATDAVWCKPAPVVERLIGALRKQAGDRVAKWAVDVPDAAVCPFDEFALTELLGNLVDNATKWTGDAISVSVQGDQAAGFIAVADNGPGIAAADLDVVLGRGQRLDPSAPGQGLGLAIVTDMVRQRGASFALTNRPEGGLMAKVSWGDEGA